MENYVLNLVGMQYSDYKNILLTQWNNNIMKLSTFFHMSMHYNEKTKITNIMLIVGLLLAHRYMLENNEHTHCKTNKETVWGKDNNFQKATPW